MASFPSLLLSSLLLLSLLSLSSSSSSKPQPHSLVLPVRKDQTTLQYVTRIRTRTPLTLLNFVLDLGGRFLWARCDSTYVSSTYRPVHCSSPQCALLQSPFGCGGTCLGPARPGCSNNSCGTMPDSPKLSSVGDLAQDLFVLASTDGSKPGPLVSVPQLIFSCAPKLLLKRLARGSVGMAGFGQGPVGLPAQLGSKFAICLTSSASSDGVIFIGDVPYNLLPSVDASQSLMYTPLLVNPVSTAGSYVEGEKSVEYFIGVTSIKINGEPVPINATLLAIDKDGNGGTKISTVAPYTQLERSIYEALTTAFATALSGVKRVPAVGKFKLCYNAKDLGSTRVGPGVPQIDLVLQSQQVYWRIFGANSMVEAKKGVLCLGLVNGGSSPRTTIVIGGYQLEDNLVQFDVKNGRLGFSSSLLFRQTTCANFNFTAKA